MAAWDPFLELERLRREIDRATGEISSRPSGSRLAFLPGRGARQYPLVNVADDGEKFYVEALAPGVDPAKLDVTVVRQTVSIAGEKPGLPGVPPERVHRVERAAGRFVRTIELPAEVDASKVEAQYRQGMLLLTLPRAETARPRRVTVQPE